MNTVPTANLYRRGKDNERRFDKNDRGLGGTLGAMGGGGN